MSGIHSASHNTHNTCGVFTPPGTTYITHVGYSFRQQYMLGIYSARHNIHNTCRVFILPATTHIIHVGYSLRQAQHTQYTWGLFCARHGNSGTFQENLCRHGHRVRVVCRRGPTAAAGLLCPQLEIPGDRGIRPQPRAALLLVVSMIIIIIIIIIPWVCRVRMHLWSDSADES